MWQRLLPLSAEKARVRGLTLGTPLSLPLRALTSVCVSIFHALRNLPVQARQLRRELRNLRFEVCAFANEAIEVSRHARCSFHEQTSMQGTALGRETTRDAGSSLPLRLKAAQMLP